MNQEKMWTGRSQTLLNIIREQMRDAILTGITPAGVIRLLHAADAPGTVKVELLDFFTTMPGFLGDVSEQGLYHYEFIGQLEHLCDGLNAAHAQGLIK